MTARPGDEPAGDDGTVIAALGDSITAGSPGYRPRPGGARRLRVRRRRAQLVTGTGPSRRPTEGIEIRNCGVFGERTDEIAARLDECAEGADGVIVQGGINDIAQRYDVAQRGREPPRRSSQEAKALGLPVAITDVLPWNNGYPTPTRRSGRSTC